jgi:hypothetical protein
MRIYKGRFFLILERFPQAKNGAFDPLSVFGLKKPLPASWPKRAGYGQKIGRRIFA